MRSPADRLQTQRFEYKYLVSENVALGVRDFVRSYLTLDEYGETLPNLSYPVHSLYVDSPDLKLYHSTVNGDKNRFKLRVRFYESRPDAPVYFEIKRRLNNTIRKERGAVRRDAVGFLLKGDLPCPDHLASDLPQHMVAVQHFTGLVARLRARPRTHVAYLREAWRSEGDNSVRVTIDRDTRTEICPGTRLETDLSNPSRVFGCRAVVELKFTGRFPDWFRDLVRVFGLVQCSAAKYADGVTGLGADRVAQAFSLEEVLPAVRRRLERMDPEAAAGDPGLEPSAPALSGVRSDVA